MSHWISSVGIHIGEEPTFLQILQELAGSAAEAVLCQCTTSSSLSYQSLLWSRETTHVEGGTGGISQASLHLMARGTDTLQPSAPLPEHFLIKLGLLG